MGSFCSSVEKVPSLQRLRYDLTPLAKKNVPLVWLVGATGSGRKTHSELLEDRLNYISIIVTDLLREEAAHDTDRGKQIKYAFKNKIDHVPEAIVIDLIKERMLRTLPDAKGYVINDFPTSAREGALFESEIAQVHVIIYLYADMNTMINRCMQNYDKVDPIVVKKEILAEIKHINNAIKSHSDKIEKISTNAPIGETYGKIQGAISVHYKAVNPNAELFIPENTKEMSLSLLSHSDLKLETKSGGRPSDAAISCYRQLLWVGVLWRLTHQPGLTGLRLCEADRPFLRFHKVRTCHKSNLPVIGWKPVLDPQECMRFARERGGLAFNYSPPDAANLTRSRSRSCEVLGCPEIGAAATLILDEGYDYYSAYGNLNATENATCIKSVGVFALMEEKLNYTESIQNCQAIGADLPDILSEARTNTLSKLIETEVTEWYKATYVGLDDTETEGIFLTPLGSSLNCTTYRAWAPGHPRAKHKSEDCVVLDSKKMWRVVNCKIKLPSICEFYPESPIEHIDIPADVAKCTEIKDEKKKKKCKIDSEEFRKLFEKSPRLDKCAFMGE